MTELLSGTDIAASVLQEPANREVAAYRWSAMWYVEWREWMIGFKWYGNPLDTGIRIKLGPFGVTFFRVTVYSYEAIRD